MAIEFKTCEGVIVAVLPGTLDDTQGQQFATELTQRIPKGSPMVVDGSELRILSQQGVHHLITAQRWTSVPERKHLTLAGFNPTVWRAIVDSESDFLFDAKPTLAEALRSLGVAGAIASPPASAPVSAARRAPAAGDTWLRSVAGQAPPPPSPIMPVAPVVYRAAAPASAGGKRFVWLALATLLLLIVVAGAAWWLLANRAPTLTLSAPAVVAEEDGKEVDEVTAQVQHGRLLDSSWADLPKGLFFEPPADEAGGHTYTLRGKAEIGAKSATVQLQAVGDDGQPVKPVAFTVNVKPKPMAWQLNSLQSLDLKVGREIWSQSKFVTSATEATVKAGLPPGLTVERVPGRDKDWQLAGTPAAAGIYQVVFTALSPTGSREEKACTLEVAPDAAAAVAVATPVALKPVSNNQAPVAVEPKAANLDDGMRKFLLERIENLPSHYTDADRENLRLMVNGLQRARLVQRVVFERDGQTDLSAEQAAKLKATLQSGDNAKLLEDPDCQMLIVGYASQTGSLAANVRLSKMRARTVNEFVQSVLGHGADLCGDYGPTDVLDQGAAQTNRAVEVYAGMLNLTADLRPKAISFKQDFNRRHGVH